MDLDKGVYVEMEVRFSSSKDVDYRDMPENFISFQATGSGRYQMTSATKTRKQPSRPTSAAWSTTAT